MRSTSVPVALLFAVGCGAATAADVPTTLDGSHLKGLKVDEIDWKAKTADWWRASLPPAVHQVCREAGTERPWTGALLDQKAAGTFACSSCGQALFSSEHKFESGTGWPSFFDVAAGGKVKVVTDTSHGMVREEVRCGRCDAHLGHVFDDGPKPTAKRYCINSVCLLHVPAGAPRG
jgi:peptide-methionine (R)-S-oxide reductase